MIALMKVKKDGELPAACFACKKCQRWKRAAAAVPEFSRKWAAAPRLHVYVALARTHLSICAGHFFRVRNYNHFPHAIAWPMSCRRSAGLLRRWPAPGIGFTAGGWTRWPSRPALAMTRHAAQGLRFCFFTKGSVAS